MGRWLRAARRHPVGVQRTVELLGVPEDRVLAVPNGVDIDLFAPRTTDRAAFWRRVLVERPEGWLAGQAPGSARYDDDAVTRLADGVALVYVGRFTAVKRLDRLIAAFGRAQADFARPAGLVLVGGHPGEWELEHPADIAARLGVPHVLLAGWQAQERLPAFLSAAEAIVLTSKHEQFGQVLVEAMACDVPAVATRSPGPSAIIEDGRTGWLVDPDDDAGLAAALVEAVNDPPERGRRGQAARRDGARALLVGDERGPARDHPSRMSSPSMGPPGTRISSPTRSRSSKAVGGSPAGPAWSVADREVAAVIDWWAANARPLPWRTSRDVYAIWVSRRCRRRRP